MGLDQYITIRHKSTNKSYQNYADYWKLSDEERAEKKCPDCPEKDFIIGNWRKSNQIHRWFVVNIQNGNDDCGRYEISRQNIIDIKELCEKVISFTTKSEKPVEYWKDGNGVSHKCWQVPTYTITEEGMKFVEENLPTQSGFFFGGVKYDDWYFYDVERSIEQFNRILNFLEMNYWSLYEDKKNSNKYTGRWVLEYSSSW
jgi:hypothetical protein